jgi:hypothetical protein
MALYNANSPYYNTDVVNKQFLDIMIDRPIPRDPIDVYWQITETYSMRPDLLAFDLYNDSALWWVFAQRNPNTLKDPLFDFVTGTYIFIPQINNLKTALGI